MVVIGRLEGEGTATALLDRMAREWRLAGVLRVALVERGGDPAVRTALLEAGAQDFIAEPPARERAARRASGCCSSTRRCGAARTPPRPSSGGCASGSTPP